MVKCRSAIPFITVAKSKRYCKGVKSIASELTFTTKSNTFYSLPIPFTFSTVIKGLALSIFICNSSEMRTGIVLYLYKTIPLRTYKYNLYEYIFWGALCDLLYTVNMYC